MSSRFVPYTNTSSTASRSLPLVFFVRNLATPLPVSSQSCRVLSQAQWVCELILPRHFICLSLDACHSMQATYKPQERYFPHDELSPNSTLNDPTSVLSAYSAIHTPSTLESNCSVLQCLTQLSVGQTSFIPQDSPSERTCTRLSRKNTIDRRTVFGGRYPDCGSVTHDIRINYSPNSATTHIGSSIELVYVPIPLHVCCKYNAGAVLELSKIFSYMHTHRKMLVRLRIEPLIEKEKQRDEAQGTRTKANNS